MTLVRKAAADRNLADRNVAAAEQFLRPVDLPMKQPSMRWLTRAGLEGANEMSIGEPTGTCKFRKRRLRLKVRHHHVFHATLLESGETSPHRPVSQAKTAVCFGQMQDQRFEHMLDK